MRRGIATVNIGFGNVVFADRIIAILSPDSAPIKRAVQEARDSGRLIDATYGRRSRSVIFSDNDRLILSPLQPETVAARAKGRPENGELKAESGE